MHSEEPLLEVTAPVAEAQLVETVLLNQITLHTTLASKAARYVIAAEGRGLVDFAFRRTHGVEAAMAVARAWALVGFAATSNVEAARRYDLARRARWRTRSSRRSRRARGVPCVRRGPSGPHDVPRRHLRHAKASGRRSNDRGARPHRRVGVRLDSGDLDALARAARAMLDDAGLPHARIFASGGLDEHEVTADPAGAPVDAFGIGTQLGVSADAPYVDSVYKLVEFGGRAVMKLSSGKAPPDASRPGARRRR